MADLTITAANVALIKAIEEFTLPTNEQVDAGEAVSLVAASGKLALADEDGAAPLNEPEGVAVRSGRFSGDAVTCVKVGWLDVGDALASMDYGDKVYLSDTAGKLADADPGNGIIIGEVWPAFGNATADKILYVNIETAVGTVDTAQLADDSVTKAKLAGGFMNVTLVAGGSAGDHTVTGIATGDEIVFVGHFSTAAAIATLADLSGEFSVTGADTINNGGGTDTSSDQLMVMWMDLT